MIVSQRLSFALVCIALIMVVIAGGCTSSGNSTAGSTAGSSTPGDSGEFHSSFAELAGTYVSADNPAASIVLDPTGAARVVAGSSQADTSYYMEMGELKLADGSSIGPYPIQDNALIYQGVKYQKKA